MKKEYVKPYLALESFQLVAALAGSCDEPLNHSLEKCNFVDEDFDTFNPLFAYSACEMNIFDTDEGVCYHEAVAGGIYLTS